jgi:hypothetical protein
MRAWLKNAVWKLREGSNQPRATTLLALALDIQQKIMPAQKNTRVNQAQQTLHYLYWCTNE